MVSARTEVGVGGCIGPKVVRFADPARATRSEALSQLLGGVKRFFRGTTGAPVTQVRCGPREPFKIERVVASSVDLQSDETGRASYTYFKIERRRWLLWEELNGGWLSRRDGLQECRSEMLPGTARYRAVVDAYTVAEVNGAREGSPDHERQGRPVWRSPSGVTHHYRYVSPSVRLTRSADAPYPPPEVVS